MSSRHIHTLYIWRKMSSAFNMWNMVISSAAVNQRKSWQSEILPTVTEQLVDWGKSTECTLPGSLTGAHRVTRCPEKFGTVLNYKHLS